MTTHTTTPEQHQAAIDTIARWVKERMMELGTHDGSHPEHSEVRDGLIDRERAAIEDAVLAIV